MYMLPSSTCKILKGYSQHSGEWGSQYPPPKLYLKWQFWRLTVQLAMQITAWVTEKIKHRKTKPLDHKFLCSGGLILEHLHQQQLYSSLERFDRSTRSSLSNLNTIRLGRAFTNSGGYTQTIVKSGIPWHLRFLECFFPVEICYFNDCHNVSIYFHNIVRQIITKC